MGTNILEYKALFDIAKAYLSQAPYYKQDNPTLAQLCFSSGGELGWERSLPSQKNFN